MPPSGFSKKAVEALGEFDKALLSDLQQEVNDGKYPTLETGMASEIELIKKTEKNPESSPFKHSITSGLLPLVRMRYEEMHVVLAKGGDLQAYQDDVKQELLEVHINDKGDLVRREE